MRPVSAFSAGFLCWVASSLTAGVSSSALPVQPLDVINDVSLFERQHGHGHGHGHGHTDGWPYGPFKTSGREIQTSRGDNVTFVGTNWPLSGETMIPEGLQYTSVRHIVEKMASLGFNFIRHGYAIQMVDELYPHSSADDTNAKPGKDISIKEALHNGLGEKNGTIILNKILENNKEFNWTEDTTRFEILDDVAKVEKEYGILMHPDNHVSKAQWCCSHTDGNAWFNDVYFDVKNWTRGLAHMAQWSKKHDNIVSISLRNELRDSWNVTNTQYSWLTWAGNMTLGLDAIHSANPELLITLSGLQYDEDLSALTSHLDLNTAYFYNRNDTSTGKDPVYFEPENHPWGKNVVLEMHRYSSTEDQTAPNCEAIQAGLYKRGGNALGYAAPSDCTKNTTDIRHCQDAPKLYPVILSEFGHSQDASLFNDTLTNCLQDWTIKNKIGWSQWSLAGSYMTRQGTQDFDDTWALFSHDYSQWRDQDAIDNYWKKWVKQMGKTGLEM
ncbi:unnamed protein product [Sympodiomycopsis kandeliae]